MRCAVLITGASRGFGRYLALDFASELASNDVELFLWARDADALQETSRLVRDARGPLQQTGKLEVVVQSVDLSGSAKIDALLAHMTSTERYDRVFLVHNAGALGALGFAQECPLPAEMATHWELNVTSVLWLNKRFLNVFGASGSVTQLVIMNVSSRSAIAPYQTLNLYCTAKAAREMHFRVLAEEQVVKVLSYSPGAMDTDMQQTMRDSPLLDPALKKWLMEMKQQDTLVPVQQSSKRGVVVAVNGDFESGKHTTFDELKYVDEY